MQCFSCNTSLKYLFNTTDYVTKENFEIFRCDNCNIDFPNPRPRDVDKYYPKKYRAYSGIINFVFDLFYGFLAKKIDLKFQDIHEKNMLEIGCGNGLILRKFKNLKWNVYGTERGEEVDKRYDKSLNISNKSIEEFDDDAFNLILLNNSLEHIYDYKKLIYEIKKKLKINGLAIINIPSRNSIQYKYGKGKWFHLDTPRHLQIFDDNFFKNYENTNGLILNNVSSIGFFWEFYGWFQTLNNLYFKNENLFFCSLTNFKKYQKYFFLGILQFLILCIPSVILTLLALFMNKFSIKNFELKKIK